MKELKKEKRKKKEKTKERKKERKKEGRKGGEIVMPYCLRNGTRKIPAIYGRG